jgi:phenylacetate-CoA ligase
MAESRSFDMYDPNKETMSPGERKQYYDDRVRRVADYAYQHSPAIREKFQKAGIHGNQVRTVKDLESLPVTTKEELVDLQKADPPLGGFLAVPPEKVWKFFVSTGPIYDAVGTSESLWSMQEQIFHNVGFRRGDVVLIAFSYHLVPAAWSADEALRRLGVTVLPGGVGNVVDQLEAARKLGVTGYLGTPSFLRNLIGRAEELGYDFQRDFKLRRAAVGGEPLTGSLRSELEDRYGVTTVNVFGTADIQWVAYECPSRTGMHIAEEVLIEIVDPDTGAQLEPGETGEIVVTSFDETYPLIRFGLGDLACLSNEVCSCGRTSHRIVKFAGRVRDTARVRGRFLYPQEVRKGLERFQEVSKFQVLVGRRSHRDTLTLVVERPREDAETDLLEQNLRDSFKEHCLLKIDEIRFVPAGTITDEKIIIDERKWD